MYKVVNNDGKVLSTQDETTEIHFNTVDEAMQARKELENLWFVVPTDWIFITAMGGKSWTTPGQRG